MASKFLLLLLIAITCLSQFYQVSSVIAPSSRRPRLSARQLGWSGSASFFALFAVQIRSACGSTVTARGARWRRFRSSPWRYGPPLLIAARAMVAGCAAPHVRRVLCSRWFPPAKPRPRSAGCLAPRHLAAARRFRRSPPWAGGNGFWGPPPPPWCAWRPWRSLSARVSGRLEIALAQQHGALNMRPANLGANTSSCWREDEEVPLLAAFSPPPGCVGVRICTRPGRAPHDFAEPFSRLAEARRLVVRRSRTKA